MYQAIKKPINIVFDTKEWKTEVIFSNGAVSKYIIIHIKYKRQNQSRILVYPLQMNDSTEIVNVLNIMLFTILEEKFLEEYYFLKEGLQELLKKDCLKW